MNVAAKQTLTSPGYVLDQANEQRGSWSVEESYEYCARLARAHYENFPVGSVLIPGKLRKHFYSIYAFARIADDFADEGYREGHAETERIEWLLRWEEMLRECYSGHSNHPVFVALSQTADRFGLPRRLFEDLLSAFTQDVTTHRYNSFPELLDYCRRSANPIGRLILLLFGHKDEELHLQSDCICTALQLANHWQDVGVDLDKDRIYLPLEDMERFGMSPDALASREPTPEFRGLMAFEVARARDLFGSGKPLCSAVGGRLGVELRAVWLGGVRILDRIEGVGFDVFSDRPAITAADKLNILFSAVTRKGFLG